MVRVHQGEPENQPVTFCDWLFYFDAACFRRVFLIYGILTEMIKKKPGTRPGLKFTTHIGHRSTFVTIINREKRLLRFLHICL